MGRANKVCRPCSRRGWGVGPSPTELKNRIIFLQCRIFEHKNPSKNNPETWPVICILGKLIANLTGLYMKIFFVLALFFSLQSCQNAYSGDKIWENRRSNLKKQPSKKDLKRILYSLYNIRYIIVNLEHRFQYAKYEDTLAQDGNEGEEESHFFFHSQLIEAHKEAIQYESKIENCVRYINHTLERMDLMKSSDTVFLDNLLDELATAGDDFVNSTNRSRQNAWIPKLDQQTSNELVKLQNNLYWQ